MSETKSFDIRVLGSITSGVLLLQDFSQVHEAIEWLAGYPVWTHELPEVGRRLASLLREQFPDLPEKDKVGDWEECAGRLIVAHPEPIAMKKGEGHRQYDPIATAVAKRNGNRLYP